MKWQRIKKRIKIILLTGLMLVIMSPVEKETTLIRQQHRMIDTCLSVMDRLIVWKFRHDSICAEHEALKIIFRELYMMQEQIEFNIAHEEDE